MANYGKIEKKSQPDKALSGPSTTDPWWIDFVDRKVNSEVAHFGLSGKSLINKDDWLADNQLLSLKLSYIWDVEYSVFWEQFNL